MTPTDDVLRPDDLDLLQASLRWVHARGMQGATYGGLVDKNRLAITRVLGGRTRALAGVRVPMGEGLGGQAMLRGSPVQVEDYLTDRRITHQHDVPVQTEGLSAMAAVPIIVGGHPRAVIYTAVRSRGSVGNAILDATVHAARTTGQEMAVRDEVDRRVGMIRAAGDEAGPIPLERALGRDALEAVRQAHAELVALAAQATDPQTAERMREVARMLENRSPSVTSPTVALSPRESDVLIQASLGLSYAEIAARLSLKPITVKGYMRTVLQKLQVHSRTEAVTVARRLGLLP